MAEEESKFGDRKRERPDDQAAHEQAAKKIKPSFNTFVPSDDEDGCEPRGPPRRSDRIQGKQKPCNEQSSARSDQESSTDGDQESRSAYISGTTAAAIDPSAYLRVLDQIRKSPRVPQDWEDGENMLWCLCRRPFAELALVEESEDHDGHNNMVETMLGDKHVLISCDDPLCKVLWYCKTCLFPYELKNFFDYGDKGEYPAAPYYVSSKIPTGLQKMVFGAVASA